ncbi:hypothetical protein [Klebsiella michiganensis]|uniref:hypothetical protein n=1 Tax=Klebsiella michiganensis TaxID=1134687 RepID=UPI0036D334AB
MTTNITALVQRLKVAAKNGCCHTLFPDDCLALVEALEKAQAENTAGVAGMAESYETSISMLKSRIAELESRTVKLPRLPDDCDRIEVHFKYAVALAAAGIKVEAE